MSSPAPEVRSGLTGIGTIRPRSAMVLCHEVMPVHTAPAQRTRDEGWPFEIGNQVLISSHCKPLGSKILVVNVAE
jgi:hypothetical protein